MGKSENICQMFAQAGRDTIFHKIIRLEIPAKMLFEVHHTSQTGCLYTQSINNCATKCYRQVNKPKSMQCLDSILYLCYRTERQMDGGSKGFGLAWQK
uniref:Uncharacterized protein n=1 Tax=Salmo trutta TaxID=8032 RepID=A0A674BZH1_SALTR